MMCETLKENIKLGSKPKKKASVVVTVSVPANKN